MVYKDEKIGDWRIKNFVVDDKGEQMHNIREDLNGTFRYISAGTYTKLLYRTEVVMSNVPAEKKDHEYFFKKVINKKPKKILISGLGLGMIIEELLKHNFIERIVVVEKNKEVIELTGKYFTDKRLEIIHEDIFVYETEEKFDMVWHDIWTYIEKTNLREMNLLRGKFKSQWQGFWCESEVRELVKSYRDNKMLENIFKATLGDYKKDEEKFVNEIKDEEGYGNNLSTIEIVFEEKEKTYFFKFKNGLMRFTTDLSERAKKELGVF